MTDQELIGYLLEMREWYNFDCKRASIKPQKLLETIVAFANTDGGMIALGIEDPSKAQGYKRILGISKDNENISEILKLMEKEIDPYLPNKGHIEIKTKNAENKPDKIILIKIDKSRDVHSLKNGDTFVRKGDQNVKIGNREITRLKYEKGSISYEDELSNIDSIGDLNTEIFTQYKKDNKSEQEDDLQFLKDNGLSAKKGKKLLLTKAGVLLFAENPSITLKAKCSIKISHYFGTSQNYTGEPNFVSKPFTIEGPLIHQIKETLEYFTNIVKKSPPKLKGATFQPTMQIPEWAFQEAITNAVIHRNYSIQDDIQVRFFDDRIEIESPGSYPAFITPRNIKTERFARNPIIQRTLNRFTNSPNLDIGEGVDRMYEVMSKQNLYDPLYISSAIRPNSVLLILFNLQKVSYWDTVNKYLEKNYRITNTEARKITGIQDTVEMSRILRNWVKQKLLYKVPSKFKGGTYYKKYGVDDQLPFAKGIANGERADYISSTK